MNRKTQITIETHSVTIIRVKGSQFSTHCERCQKTVAAFAPKQIAEFLRLDLKEVYRRIETQEIHLTRSGESTALICGATLGGKKDHRTQLLIEGENS